MKNKKKILISPLDWGLGHATRCIPIINFLVQANYEVIIASSGSSQKLLKEYFPQLEHLYLEGYQVKYAQTNVKLNLASQVPKILSAITRENTWLNKIIKDYQIDAVISDNRYGLFSDKIPTVLISHQLNIQAPKFVKKTIKNLVTNYIEKFTECWVPDYAGEINLAGELSHQKEFSDKIKYLGPLSRFTNSEKQIEGITYDYLGIVSGPESQRTIFDNLLTNVFLKSKKKCLIICGLPQENFKEQINNVTRISHLKTKDFLDAIKASENIICRSGYSTIMDLISLKRGAILVPTPGQTEQEYLSKHLHGKFGFSSLKQKEIKIKFSNSSSSLKSNVNLPINDMTVVKSFLDKI